MRETLIGSLVARKHYGSEVLVHWGDGYDVLKSRPWLSADVRFGYRHVILRTGSQLLAQLCTDSMQGQAPLVGASLCIATMKVRFANNDTNTHTFTKVGRIPLRCAFCDYKVNAYTFLITIPNYETRRSNYSPLRRYLTTCK